MALAEANWAADCHRVALDDLVRQGDYPESVVYMQRGVPTLDSWIRPCSTVRIWSTVRKNVGVVDRFFASKFSDATRLDHVVAEIISTDPQRKSDTKRHFALGYVPSGDFAGKLKFFHQFQGRAISPDWVFVDKLKAQRQKPHQTHLQLLAVGVLNEKVYCKLKRLVESSRSHVARLGDKEGRHVYQITSPAIEKYQGLTCPLWERKNCASFVTYLFEDMITCTNRLNLVVPGSCKPLRRFSCSEEGLSRHGDLPCGDPNAACHGEEDGGRLTDPDVAAPDKKRERQTPEAAEAPAKRLRRA